LTFNQQLKFDRAIEEEQNLASQIQHKEWHINLVLFLDPPPKAEKWV